MNFNEKEMEELKKINDVQKNLISFFVFLNQVKFTKKRNSEVHWSWNSLDSLARSLERVVL